MLLPVALGTALLPSRAAAQDVQSTAHFTLPTLSVEGTWDAGGVNGYVARNTGAATKTNTPVLELPRSVSTVTRQEMDDRDAQSVMEALQYTPGVNTYNSPGNLTREYPTIRGFQVYQYLDGLKLHDSNWGVEPYGLERIDILRGPAAMLYGQGSPGGLVNMTSKRPTEQPFREMLLQFGLHDKIQGAFDIGGPIDDKKTLLYRFTGLGRYADGEVDFTRNERVYLAPAVTWRPTVDTSLTVLASYQYDPNLSVFQHLPRVGTILPGPNGAYISREMFLGEPGYHDTSKESIRVGYEFKHRFNEIFSFEQNVAYQHIDIQLMELQGRGAMVGLTGAAREMFLANYVIDVFQTDNRMKAEFDTGPISHKVLFGIDYSWIPNYQGTGINRASSYALDLYNPVYGQRLGSNIINSKRYQDFSQLGVYLQDQIKWGNLSLVIGGRNDWASLDQKTKTLNTTTGQFNDPAWSEKDDTAFTSQAGLIYTFANGFAPYVSYSESFLPTTGTDWSGAPFKPTTGTQYEGGIKFQPVGVNALFTAAIFDLTQQNVLTPDTANPGFRKQTGEVRSRGLELEFKTSHLQGFNVAAAYTFLDAEVTQTNTPGGLGKMPFGVPQHLASLWSTYTFGGGSPLEGLTVGGGVRYVGPSFGDELNTFEVPSFTLVDAVLRYRLGALTAKLENWDVALNAKNLFDTRYVANCSASTLCYYGAGRSADLTIRVRF